MLLVPHLMLQAHQPDDGAAVWVALLLILLGGLLPQLLLITGRLTPETKGDDERTEPQRRSLDANADANPGDIRRYQPVILFLR